MSIEKVYIALEKVIRANGFTPLFTYAEAIKLPHVSTAHIEADRVYVSSRQIARGCYGHPKMEVQARLVDGRWMLGEPRTGKLIPLFQEA